MKLFIRGKTKDKKEGLRERMIMHAAATTASARIHEIKRTGKRRRKRRKSKAKGEKGFVQKKMMNHPQEKSISQEKPLDYDSLCNTQNLSRHYSLSRELILTKYRTILLTDSDAHRGGYR